MITILVDNIWARIQGLSAEQSEMLYEKLSYETDQDKYIKLKHTNCFYQDFRKHLFQQKRQKFPAGLVTHVTGLLNCPVKIQDTRKVPDKYNYYIYKTPLPQLYPHQQEMVQRVKDNWSNTFQSATASGKTLVMIEATRIWGVNTLIIAPSRGLKNQLLEEFTRYFGREMVGDHKKPKTKPITICNIQGIIRKNQEWFNQFDAVIWEEVHHVSAVSYYDLNKNFLGHITYRLGVSATPFRNDDGECMKLQGITGIVNYEYSARQAILDGFILRPKFFIYKAPRSHCQTESKEWHIDYDNFITTNRLRNDKIVSITQKLLAGTNKTVLILCNRLEQIDYLASKLKDYRIVTGEQKEADNKKALEDFRLGKTKLILASSGCLAEGIDLPGINVLILAGGFKSEILISQSIGRCIRKDDASGKKNGIVIDFDDTYPLMLARHSKIRQNIYKNVYFPEDIKMVA